MASYFLYRRREFITLIGGAIAARPLAAHAQGERIRRIGVLMHTAADEPESQARLAAFMQGLQESGWAVGRNLRIDYRWSLRCHATVQSAAELVALRPEVILGGVGATVLPRSRYNVLRMENCAESHIERRSS